MSRQPGHWTTQVQQEVEECAKRMFLELTRGRPRPEPWYRWYLCERHGGVPLIDPCMPARQVACWDGEDIVIAEAAPLSEIVDALPEELAHRLSAAEACRFEPMNYYLRHAPALGRAEFQERVGQRVAELFVQKRGSPRDASRGDSRLSLTPVGRLNTPGRLGAQLCVEMAHDLRDPIA